MLTSQRWTPSWMLLTCPSSAWTWLTAIQSTYVRRIVAALSRFNLHYSEKTIHSRCSIHFSTGICPDFFLTFITLSTHLTLLIFTCLHTVREPRASHPGGPSYQNPDCGQRGHRGDGGGAHPVRGRHRQGERMSNDVRM